MEVNRKASWLNPISLWNLDFSHVQLVYIMNLLSLNYFYLSTFVYFYHRSIWSNTTLACNIWTLCFVSYILTKGVLQSVIDWPNRHLIDHGRFSECSTQSQPSRSANQPTVRWAILFFSFFFFIKKKYVVLNFSQTNTDRVPPLLRPIAFDPIDLIFRSIMLTLNPNYLKPMMLILWTS